MREHLKMTLDEVESRRARGEVVRCCGVERTCFVIVTPDERAEPRHAHSAKLCAICGRAIEQEYEGEDRWVDFGTAGAASLVYCHDQDETHDGIRHVYLSPSERIAEHQGHI